MSQIATETCSCGASITATAFVVDGLLRVWRKNHKHEVIRREDIDYEAATAAVFERLNPTDEWEDALFYEDDGDITEWRRWAKVIVDAALHLPTEDET